MNETCRSCGMPLLINVSSHAQSEHAKAPAGQVGEGMGGACDRCDCPAYWPLTCDDCGRPLDPADRSA